MKINLKNTEIILASGSARRREIMEKLGLDFKIVVSNYVENIQQNLLPKQIVLELALGKGLSVWSQKPEACIIAADTIVAFDNHRLGKPKNKEQLREWLEAFSGKVVEIWTGNVIIYGNEIKAEATKGTVNFKEISPERIEEYLSDENPDWQDKAGGFAVQGKAKDMLEWSGEYSTILGLSEKFLGEIFSF